jgi:hypothetical protein
MSDVNSHWSASYNALLLKAREARSEGERKAKEYEDLAKSALDIRERLDPNYAIEAKATEEAVEAVIVSQHKPRERLPHTAIMSADEIIVDYLINLKESGFLDRTLMAEILRQKGFIGTKDFLYRLVGRRLTALMSEIPELGFLPGEGGFFYKKKGGDNNGNS